MSAIALGRPESEQPGRGPAGSRAGSRAGTHPDDETLSALTPLIRRVAAARLHSRDEVDDVVQETLARVVVNAPNLDVAALAPYAVVTARNLIASQVRAEQRRRRHTPRLVELHGPDRPDEQLLRQEEHRAVTDALGRLSGNERRTLVAHEVEGTDTRTLADATGTTPGNVAVQLSRGRAKLRVEYLLAYRRVELPTSRCRPVLYALSAGDRRRQQALRAGQHLLDCAACAELAEPLVERKRALAGVVPLLGLRPLLDRLHKGSSAQSGAVLGASALMLALLAPHYQAATAAGPGSPPPLAAPLPGTPLPEAGAAGLGGAGVGAGAAGTASSDDPSNDDPTTTGSGGLDLATVDPGDLAALAGREVAARGVRVQSVDADEGFWVGSSQADRLWVQLTGDGESPVQVHVGDRVSFDGVILAHDDRMPSLVGVDVAEGAGQLAAQRAHVRVQKQALRPS